MDCHLFVIGTETSKVEIAFSLPFFRQLPTLTESTYLFLTSLFVSARLDLPLSCTKLHTRAYTVPEGNVTAGGSECDEEVSQWKMLA